MVLLGVRCSLCSPCRSLGLVQRLDGLSASRIMYIRITTFEAMKCSAWPQRGARLMFCQAHMANSYQKAKYPFWKTPSCALQLRSQCRCLRAW